jgi:tetratricopeptide (TPR) repeat protein
MAVSFLLDAQSGASIVVMEAIQAAEGVRQAPWDDTGMRASLSAVRSAQAQALARNRRETWKARVVVGTAVATFAIGLVAVKTRAARKAHASRPVVAAAVAPARPLVPLGSEPALSAPLVAEPTPAAPAKAPAVAAAPAPSSDVVADAGAIAECEVLCKRHRWRQAAEPCALAVRARPNDANLALGMAQSEHARNRMAEAGQWAARAIALDPNLAEAFVIQAHAERQAGDDDAAARDFRRYLELAPRGWHAREAREALRDR